MSQLRKRLTTQYRSLCWCELRIESPVQLDSQMDGDGLRESGKNPRP